MGKDMGHEKGDFGLLNVGLDGAEESRKCSSIVMI
jgi:hypothetical protein